MEVLVGEFLRLVQFLSSCKFVRLRITVEERENEVENMIFEMDYGRVAIPNTSLTRVYTT